MERYKISFALDISDYGKLNEDGEPNITVHNVNIYVFCCKKHYEESQLLELEAVPFPSQIYTDLSVKSKWNSGIK